MRFQPSGQHLGAFGATEATAESMGVIKMGATDAATNYAVTALAANLRSATYEGKKEAVLNDVIGGVTNAASKGVFTKGLDSQVKKFQAAKGLKADGIVGANTWKALGLKSERKAVTPSAPAPSTTPGTELAPGGETKQKITDKGWFWPAVALAGVGTVTTAIIVIKRRRSAAQ